MDKESKNKKRKMPDSTIIALIVLVVVLGGIGILWSIMSNGSESYTFSTSTTRINYLDCQITGLVKDAFFMSNESNTSNHRVKTAFEGDNIQKATYTYTGTFRTEEVAKSEMNKMQGSFYDYIGRIGMDVTKFESGFTAGGTKVTANVFIEKNYLNNKTAKLIFLDDEAVSKLGKENASVEIKKIYQSKGFTCNDGQ